MKHKPNVSGYFFLFFIYFLIRLSFYALQLKLFMASFGIFLSRLPKFLCKRHRLQHTKALGITFRASVYQFARQRRRVQVENLQALAQVLLRQRSLGAVLCDIFERARVAEERRRQRRQTRGNGGGVKTYNEIKTNKIDHETPRRPITQRNGALGHLLEIGRAHV